MTLHASVCSRRFIERYRSHNSFFYLCNTWAYFIQMVADEKKMNTFFATQELPYFRNIDARVRLIFVFLLLFTLPLLTNIYLLFGIAFLLFLLFLFVFKGKQLLLFFSPVVIGSFVFLSMIYTYGQTPAAFLFFPLYAEGIHLGIIIFLRICASMFLLFLVLRTLPLSTLVLVLQSLCFPALFISLTLLIMQYIFFLGKEAAIIRNAVIARLGLAKSIPWRQRIQNISTAAAAFFLHSFEMSLITYKAMLSRGFNPHQRNIEPKKWKKQDILLALLSFFFMVMLFYVDKKLEGLL